MSTAAAASLPLLGLCFNCGKVGQVKGFVPYCWVLQQVESEEVMDIVVNNKLCISEFVYIYVYSFGPTGYSNGVLCLLLVNYQCILAIFIL